MHIAKSASVFSATTPHDLRRVVIFPAPRSAKRRSHCCAANTRLSPLGNTTGPQAETLTFFLNDRRASCTTFKQDVRKKVPTRQKNKHTRRSGCTKENVPLTTLSS